MKVDEAFVEKMVNRSCEKYKNRDSYKEKAYGYCKKSVELCYDERYNENDTESIKTCINDIQVSTYFNYGK